jgi:hypothetical protein
MTPEQDNTGVSSAQKLKATLLESHATIDFLKGELADAQVSDPGSSVGDVRIALKRWMRGLWHVVCKFALRRSTRGP